MNKNLHTNVVQYLIRYLYYYFSFYPLYSLYPSYYKPSNNEGYVDENPFPVK